MVYIAREVVMPKAESKAQSDEDALVHQTVELQSPIIASPVEESEKVDDKKSSLKIIKVIKSVPIANNEGQNSMKNAEVPKEHMAEVTNN